MSPIKSSGEDQEEAASSGLQENVATGGKSVPAARDSTAGNRTLE